MKTCNRCNEEKPLDEFPKHKQMKDGRLKQCKVCKREYGRAYYKNNKEIVLERNSAYLKTSKGQEAKKRASDKYYANNKEMVKEKAKQHTKWRRKNDPSFRVRCNLRRRLREVMGGKCKPETTQKLVGCTWPELKEHIESQFTEGMSWDNYGPKGWHVDHIKPITAFEDTQVHKANHYTNLQPMWWRDNILKSNIF